MDSAGRRSTRQDLPFPATTSNLERIPSGQSQGRRSQHNVEQIAEIQDTTLDPGQPRAFRSSDASFSNRLFRQILGLNPFKTTYLSLYDSLESFSDKATAWTGATFAIVAGIPLPLIGYIFSELINEFPPSERQLRSRVIQLIGVAVAYFVVTAIYLIAFGLTSEKISIRLRERLLHCLLHLDQAYLDNHDLDVNSLLSEKIDTIKAGCSEKVGIFIQSMAYFVAAFTVGFILNAKLTGILLASVVPAITLTFVFLSPAVSRYSGAVSKQNEQANEIAESALSAVMVVQAFDMVNELCARHLAYLERSTHLSVRKATFAALQTGTVYFIAYAANGLAFYLGSNMADSGNAGTVYAVVFLILDASFVVGQFAPFLEIFARAASAKEHIQDLFDAREASKNSGSHCSTDHKPDLHNKDVLVDGVVFSYPARPTVKALNGLDLNFRSGKLTAICGTSGGGKSTLVALLLGLYDYSGNISFGTENIRRIDSSYLRSQIAVLDQESILFSGTIYDNICYGLGGQEYSDEERSARCEQAIKDAAVDFLNELPNGIFTHLGNEIQLSGGQRQRVCLARALIKRPALLILDEPTSALDARSEVLVMEAVKKVAASGTSVIMIAHRLSTVLEADHVAVMSEGKVVEQGSPLELSRQASVFRSLLDAQKTTLETKNEVMEAVNQLARKSDNRKMSQMVQDEGAREGQKTDETKPATMRTRSLFGRIFRTARPDAWIASLGLIGSVVSGGILLGEAIIFGNLVQLLNEDSGSPRYASRADFFCLMFFILACIALASYVCSGSSFGITSTRFSARLRDRILRKLLHLDLGWFHETNHSIHELMGAFTKDTGDLSCLSGVALGTIFTIITSVFGGIILAHIVAWKIAIVLLSAVPIMILAGYTRLRILTISEVRHREAYSSATALAAEACRSRRTVTALGLEGYLLDEYRGSLHKPFRDSKRFTFYSNTLLAFCFAITYFVYALAYWWGSKQVRDHDYSTKEFFTVLPALLFSAQAAGQLFSLSPEVARAKTAAKSIFTLLDANPKIMLMKDDSCDGCSSLTSISSLEKAARQITNHAKIQFNNVSLSYLGNATRQSLDGVSFSIEQGQTVAFVGPSGAGKSSTIALIERFYDPTAGSLLYEGIDIRDMDVRILRGCMGLVSQKPDLFSGSIAYNVRLGARPGSIVTDEDIEMSCKRCGLHDFITSLPEGYNTECGSAGSSKLSGGQRQRLAIARALVRDPEVLLLDEPTSALDAHSEARVQAALAEASKGRTTVIVAHRLASIQHADRIFVFDQGQIVAEGTHAALMEQGGLYASMAKAQSLA